MWSAAGESDESSRKVQTWCPDQNGLHYVPDAAVFQGQLYLFHLLIPRHKGALHNSNVRQPGCRIAGSHTRREPTTRADFQPCLHRPLMSTGCKPSHNGLPDASRSNGGPSIPGRTGQLPCPTTLSTSPSAAALPCRAGGPMLQSTGSHERGAERRAPEMRRTAQLTDPTRASRARPDRGAAPRRLTASELSLPLSLV